MSQEAFAGLRVGIVGGCQVVGLRRWALRMLPGAEVDAWHVNVGPHSTPAEILETTTKHDVIISQMPNEGDDAVLSAPAFRERGHNAVFLPIIVFTGFHPDIVFVYTQSSGEVSWVRGPIADAHSAIVTACYVLGVPEDRVPRLFNTLVFSKLAYFDAYAQAVRAIEQIFSEHGYDLSGACDRWLKEGVFMHTQNHPTIRVLGTLAGQALRMLGLETVAQDSADPLPDDLAGSAQWPCYTSIAKRIGVEGSMTFLQNRFGLPSEEDRKMPIEKFVSASYALLQNDPPLVQDRIEMVIDPLRDMLG